MTKRSSHQPDLLIPQIPIQLNNHQMYRYKYKPWRPYLITHRTQRIHCQCPGAKHHGIRSEGPVSMPQWVRAKSNQRWVLHKSDLFQCILRMLDWIGIWRIWKPVPRLELFSCLDCSWAVYSVVGRIVQPLGSAVPTGGCTWSATVFDWVVHVKSLPHEFQDLKVSQQNIWL